jgi:NADPH:quinone reductase-like Zn-dependent oxidoreductase
LENVIYRQMSPGDPDSLTKVTEALPEVRQGEVLVRIRATALNARDLAVMLGRYPIPAKPRLSPLSDAAGEIVEIGEGVRRFAVGDRVVNSFYPHWYGGPLRDRPVQYSTTIDGWLASYKVISAESLARMPDHMTFEEGATLPCSGVTAWSALSGIGAGDTVLTQGSGGVSLFAVQIARLCGARVIATTTRAHKTNKLKELGAEHVIDVRQSPEWASAVKDLTGGKGVERVVEVGGPGTLQQSIQAVRYHGQVSIIGALTIGRDQPQIDWTQLFFSQARYECIGVGSRADLEDLIRAAVNHQLRPVIDSTYTFDNFDKAVARLSGRDVFGKVVITH